MIFSPAGAHRWSLFILTLTLIGPATARSQQLPRVPDSLKTAPSVSAADRSSLDVFMTAATAQLQAPAPDQQTAARRAIENEAKVAGQPTASPAYLDAYAQLLAAKIKPLQSDASARVRLNAAVVVANIAQLANNTHLKDPVITAMSDKSDAVVLWGVKGARWIIPAQLKAAFGQAPDTTVIKAVVNAVKTHPNGTIAGAIASDAYDALALEVSNPAKMAQVKPAEHQAMVPFVLELLKIRLELYKQGVPPTPRAEATATRYLSDPNVWPIMTKEQRMQSMQTFCDLIALAAEQLKQANPGDQIDLKTLISFVGKGIAVAAAPRLDGPVAASLKPVFDVKKDSPTPAVLDAVAKVLPIVRGIPEFDKIQDPPKIVDTKPAPPPASAPTTTAPATGNGAVGNPNAPIAPTHVAPVAPAPAPTTPAPQPKPPVAPKPPPAR